MHGRTAFLLSLGAAVWGGLLLAAAVTVPVYSSDASGPGAEAGPTTLVGVNGAWALVPAAAPLVAAAVCGVLLHLCCSHGSRAALGAAWSLIGVLGLFTLAAMLSIGVFVLPAVALLAASAKLTPSAAITS